MAYIERRESKDGKVSFRVQVRCKGYPTQTATFDRKTDAKNWALKTEQEIKDGRYFKKDEGNKKTLAELIDKYLEHKLHQRGRDRETVEPHLLWWKKELGQYVLREITHVRIVECRDRLLKEPMYKKGEKKGRILSNATVIRYLASLSICFTYAIQDLGWMETNPVQDVRKPKPERGRVRFLSEQERTDLLLACESIDSVLYHVVIIALSTGARLSEILTLSWKSVDLKHQILIFEHTKNGERRSVPLSGKALELLSELKKKPKKAESWVFPHKDENRPVNIRNNWEKAVEKAKLEDFRFHDLRHTAASYLAMSGASLLEIAHILGHKKPAMTMRYSHLTKNHTASVLEKMNRKQFANG